MATRGCFFGGFLSIVLTSTSRNASVNLLFFFFFCNIPCLLHHCFRFIEIISATGWTSFGDQWFRLHIAGFPLRTCRLPVLTRPESPRHDSAAGGGGGADRGGGEGRAR